MKTYIKVTEMIKEIYKNDLFFFSLHQGMNSDIYSD